MKNFILFGTLFMVVLTAFAQSPQSFQYQAVVRDAGGNPVISQPVGVQISILQGSVSGSSVYTETHSAFTNALGIVILNVGGGIVVSGIFSTIDWGSGPYFLKVGIDPAGGTAYVDMGATQLLSVPYSLHSKTSEDAFSGNYSDLSGIPTNVSTFTNDAGYITSPNDADADPTNEIQSLSLANNTLTLSDGGSVSLSGYVDTLWRQSGSNIYNTNSGKVGVGTNTPPAKLVVQGDSTMSDSIPLFEVKDKSGHTVFIVYPDSARFYVGDDGSKTNKGAFAVSGRNTVKQPTHDFLWVTPDSTRIFTGDNEAGFGVENIATGGSQRYMKLNPDNYFIGHNSGISNTTGMFNNYLGYETGLTNTVGYYNVFLGYTAGRNNIDGSSNTFLGYAAGWNSNGQSNIAVGFNSLGNSNTGGYNVAVGNQSLAYNENGEYNVAMGNNSMFFNSSGSYNVALGVDALRGNGAGSRNIAIGYQSLRANISGNENVVLGYRAGYTNTAGSNNVFLGYYAGYTNNADYNVFIGYRSGYSNNTGSFNVANGFEALFSNISGSSNVAIGNQVLYFNTIGLDNTATGYQSLYNNIGGNRNVAHGLQALYTNTGGGQNVAIGYMASYANTTGNNNVAVGYGTLFANQTGGNNTAVGNNCFTTGTAYTNSTCLGANSAMTQSNKVRIGNASVTVIEGQVAYSFPSDGRFKNNVTEEVKGLDFINKLRPVVYNFDCRKFDDFVLQNVPDSIKRVMMADNDYEGSFAVRQSGFIAQEVELAARESGYDFNGIHKPVSENDNYSVAYSLFTVPIVKAIQELSKENTDQKNTILELQNVILLLNERIEKLENK